MNEELKYIEHPGIVTEVQKGRVKISLTGADCSACHHSLCRLGDSKTKEVEIAGNGLKSGDEVIVKINPASGYQAVALLYLLPFALMILSLWWMLRSGYNEGISGLTSLFSLLPYFVILYSFKDRLGARCTINAEKR